MRIILPFTLILLTSVAAAQAQVEASPAPAVTPEPKKAAKEIPSLLQEVERKYAKAATLTAEFSQVNETAALKQKKTSSGQLLVKRPDKVRWETNQPDKNILVSDGKKFWFYTPPFDEEEPGQVIEKKSTEVRSRLAQALLSGSFSLAKDMRFKQLSPSRFSLTPIKGGSTISRAIIDVDPETKIIKGVVLEHKGGNRTEISLSKIELGTNLKDEIFVFTAPPNTEKVTE